MSLTNADIIRIYSDPRFERTVLAILRRRLRADDATDEEESASDLPSEWGWITIAHAAVKYQLSPGDIDAAIQKRHVLGNSHKVDEDSLRVWAFDGKTRGLPVPETHLGEDLERPASAKPGAVPESYSMADAAELLQVSEERLVEHLMAGTLVQVGTDRVSRASVRKHRDHLMQLGILGPNLDPPPVPAGKPPAGVLRARLANEPVATAPIRTDDAITTREAAELLGITTVEVSTLKTKGLLGKAGWGKVSRPSVLAYKAKRGPTKYEEVVQPEGSLSYKEAADLLGIKNHDIPPLITLNEIRKAAPGFVDEDSVRAYRTRRGNATPNVASNEEPLDDELEALAEEITEDTPARDTAEYLSFELAAERYGQTAGAVRLLVGLGKIPATRDGYVLASDMEAYLAKRTASQTQPT